MEKCAQCGKDVDPNDDGLGAVTTPSGEWFCGIPHWGEWRRAREKREQRD